jgi:hypothetical protein
MLRTASLLPLLQGFRHWASTPDVSLRRSQPATGPPDSYPDRTHTGRRRRAYEHEDQLPNFTASPLALLDALQTLYRLFFRSPSKSSMERPSTPRPDNRGSNYVPTGLGTRRTSAPPARTANGFPHNTPQESTNPSASPEPEEEGQPDDQPHRDSDGLPPVPGSSKLASTTDVPMNSRLRVPFQASSASAGGRTRCGTLKPNCGNCSKPPPT